MLLSPTKDKDKVMIKYILILLGIKKENNNLIDNLKKYEEKKARI
jgi:hypothetical protein